jgi:hypothetical protein
LLGCRDTLHRRKIQRIAIADTDNIEQELLIVGLLYRLIVVGSIGPNAFRANGRASGQRRETKQDTRGRRQAWHVTKLRSDFLSFFWTG